MPISNRHASAAAAQVIDLTQTALQKNFSPTRWHFDRRFADTRQIGDWHNGDRLGVDRRDQL